MIKRLALLTLVMVCLSLPAFAADVPAGDVFGGFSILHNSGLTAYGWDASAAANVKSSIGIVGDVGGYYKNSASIYSYVFGPRFNVRKDKMTYFAEAMYGGLHSTGSNGFAMAYGGGVDVKAGKLNVRVIEFDWTPVRVSGVWNYKTTRYSFGVDMPFGKK